MLLFWFVFVASATTWYGAYRLPEEQIQYFYENNCFRGTFTTSLLSLFTCEPETGLNAFKLGEVPSDSLLCVVETRPTLKEFALAFARQAPDTVLLWNGCGNEFVLTKNQNSSNPYDYPSMCLSTSDYAGTALNVITVSSAAMKPLRKTHVASSLPTLSNDIISDIVSQVDESNLKTLVATLSNYYTRTSPSQEAKDAAAWVADYFDTYGFDVTVDTFQSNYCPNVIAEIRGTTSPDEIVVLGAHLDCRARLTNDVSLRAPGADDNGSGSALVLELARLVQANKLKFEKTLQLITFCGEEQGLVGSRALAKRYKQEGKNVVVMYNADMIGYQCFSNPALAFDTGYIDKVATQTCKNLIKTYVPTLAVGDNSGCCSDQQSFYEQGYSSVGFFECTGSTVDNPNYHKQTDTPDTLSYPQLKSFSQAAISCVLTSAGAIGSA